MSNPKRKYDLKSLAVSAVIVASLATGYLLFLQEVKQIVRVVLEARLTIALAWIVPIVVFLMHYFKHKQKAVRGDVIITQQFGVFADNAFGGLVYGTMISTAITLLKGLYIQSVIGEGVYFADLGKVDVLTVFTGLAFLLYHAIVKVIEAAREAHQVEHTEQVVNAQNEVVLPRDEEAKQ